MIRSWLFFTACGTFTGFYTNAVRKYPLMRKPILHVICTSVGCYIGYQVHMYEERAEERTEMLLKKYRHAPKLWAAQLTKEYRAYDDYNAEDEDEYEDEEEVVA